MRIFIFLVDFINQTNRKCNSIFGTSKYKYANKYGGFLVEAVEWVKKLQLNLTYGEKY